MQHIIIILAIIKHQQIIIGAEGEAAGTSGESGRRAELGGGRIGAEGDESGRRVRQRGPAVSRGGGPSSAGDESGRRRRARGTEEEDARRRRGGWGKFQPASAR